MQLIRFFIFLALVPLFFSFSLFKSDYDDTVREFRAKTAKKLEKKHQMDCIAVAGGMLGTIGISFQIHHPMDRNEARERLVDCVEDLLTAINENEEIRPFLKNYPYTTKNVEISIFSNYEDGKEVFDPYIRVVSLASSDTIYFSTKEPNKIPYKHEYCESYHEALTIVKGKKNSN